MQRPMKDYSPDSLNFKSSCVQRLRRFQKMYANRSDIMNYNTEVVLRRIYFALEQGNIFEKQLIAFLMSEETGKGRRGWQGLSGDDKRTGENAGRAAA